MRFYLITLLLPLATSHRHGREGPPRDAFAWDPDPRRAENDVHRHGDDPKGCHELGKRTARACLDDALNHCPAAALDPLAAIACLREQEATLADGCADGLKKWDEMKCSDQMKANACWSEVHASVQACKDDSAKFCGEQEKVPEWWHGCMAAHQGKLSPQCKAGAEAAHACIERHCEGEQGDCRLLRETLMPPPFGPDGPQHHERPALGVIFVSAIAVLATLLTLGSVWLCKRYECCNACKRREPQLQNGIYNPIMNDAAVV